MRLTDNVDDNIDMVCDAANSCFADNQVLADLTACQAILESRLTGKVSVLAMKYCNLFGIKGVGTAGTVLLPTHEWIAYKGIMEEVDQQFASNKSIEDSFEQHKKLFDLPRYQNLHSAKTIEEACQLVHDDGYATDPKYPSELMSVYNTYVKE